tara:strand:- start:263 stop:529 length:267 start_codon:yes stop_codon:yes gene_type:complete
MKLEPKRNWISISIPEEKQEESEVMVLLPEDYKPTQNPHRTVAVVEDPQGEYDSGTLIIVPTHVVREVKVKSESFYLVERNFVMAAVT